MITREKVISVLQELKKTEKMQDIQIGLFGSYARTEQHSESDVDIVLKANTPLLLVHDGYEEYIQSFIFDRLHCKCDVVDYYDLFEDQDFFEKENLGEHTIKANIDREVIMI